MLSRFPRRADAVLFLALALGAAGIGMVAVAGSLARVGTTFPGFLVWDDLVVVALGRPEWTGMQAHVPFRTRVAEVDGAMIGTRGDLEAVVGGTPAGTPHQYRFTGGSERTVPSMRLAVVDWIATLGAYVLNGLVFLVTGLAVFYLKPDSRQCRAVLAFGVCWGLTLLMAADFVVAGWVGRGYFALQALALASIVHLALVFPEPRVASGRPLAVLYLAAGALGLVQQRLWAEGAPSLIAVDDAVYLAIAAAGVAAMTSIAMAAVRGHTPLARRRARVVLAGAIAAFGLPMVAMLAFFLLGQPVSFSLLALTGFLFPLSIGWAVARHDLFEADRFVKQTLVYATLTALVALAYAGSVLVLERLASGLAVHRSPFFPLVFVLVALATIVPLRDRVQRALDRLFARGRVSYKDAIARASERMTALLERDAVARHVTATAGDVLFLDDVSVWEHAGPLLVARGATSDTVGAGGSSVAARERAVPPLAADDKAALPLAVDEKAVSPLPADDPGLRAFEALGRPLSRDEVDESPLLRGDRPALVRLFTRLRATLLVPLRRQAHVLGLIAVGTKRSGAPLSADDLDVLRTLAHEAAVALANAAAVEQLQVTRQHLADAERLAAIGELSAAVAHGLRNPLAGIRLAAQLGLEDVPPDAPVRENLSDVLSEVDKLEAHVRGILDFARPFEPRPEAVDVAALVCSLEATLAPRAAASGVRLVVDVPADLPAPWADRTHLGQALHELAANALDAMPHGGVLTIGGARLEGDATRVALAVSDDGPGVPAEIRDRIFQLFMTTKASGTGVGLAVVRKIVERHGGRLRLDTDVARGARFVLELPVAQSART